MNAYTKLKLHLERQAYKRGKFKGSAPADASRRGKSHFLVRHNRSDDMMCVCMHSTDIIKAYSDGRVVLNTNGWWDSSTTRLRFNEALRWFVGFGALYMKNVMGLSQPVLRLGTYEYKYYDGMEFDDSARLLTEAKPFEMRRIDKAETKEFMAEVKASGFKAMFPLLYATATPGTSPVFMFRVGDAITDADQAHRWADIISACKFKRVYNYKMGQHEMLERGDAKSCWNAIMRECKKGMYVTLKSDITTL